MSRPAPVLLLVLAAAGLYLGADLSRTHLDLVAPTGIKLDSWCDVNATFSCSAVNSSKWSRFVFGERELPVAIPAIGFFLSVAFLAVTALRGDESERKRALGITAALTVPGLLFSAWLLFVQVALLGAFCLKCLLLDVATVGTFVAAVWGHGGGVGAAVGEAVAAPFKRQIMAAVVLAIGTLLPWNLYLDAVDARSTKGAGHASAAGTEAKAGDKGNGDKAKLSEEEEEIAKAKEAIAKFTEQYATLKPKEVPVFDFDGKKGNEMGAVTVIEFADFDCPHCKMAGIMMEQDFLPRYGENVRFVFKHYPLGQKCNEGLSRDLHENACQAAVAVQCAGRQGRFWEGHHGAFDKQGDLGRGTLVDIGKQIGLDHISYEQCLDDEGAWAEVKQSVTLGRSLGLQGTPAFFVNGKELPSPHPLFVEAAVRLELRALGITTLPADEAGFFGGN